MEMEDEGRTQSESVIPSEAITAEHPQPSPPSPNRQRGIWRVAVVIALAGLTIAVGWWNSLRPQNCLRRGRHALEAGNHQAVIRESRRLLETPGFESQGRLLAGLSLMQTGRTAEALTELQHAVSDKSTAVEALTAAAACYYALGRYAETVRLARQALAQDEQSLTARRWLASALYDLGLVQPAATELQTLMRQDSQDYRSVRLLGIIHKDNERFEEAIAAYRESLRRNERQPERDSVSVELAECLVKLGRFDEAIEALQNCPRTPPVLTLLSESQQGQGLTDEAEKNVGEAIESDPTYLPAQLQRGALLLFLRRGEEAVECLKEAVTRAPYSARAHYLLSNAYSRGGLRDQADSEIRRFHEVQALERQFIDLHDVAGSQPNDSDVRYRLGVLAGQLGKPELAKMWFRSALALKPDHAAARAGLNREDPGE
jgi:tetratricopeptide (TPR) repeat protein